MGGLVALLICAAIAWGNGLKGWAGILALLAGASALVGIFGLPPMVN